MHVGGAAARTHVQTVYTERAEAHSDAYATHTAHAPVLCQRRGSVSGKDSHTLWSGTHPKVHHHGGSGTGAGRRAEEMRAEHWDQSSQCVGVKRSPSVWTESFTAPCSTEAALPLNCSMGLDLRFPPFSFFFFFFARFSPYKQRVLQLIFKSPLFFLFFLF